MIQFKKNDPIVDLINKKYFEILESNPSADGFESLLKTNERNPLKLVAIGCCYIQKYPLKARGYLSTYDNLYKLGFDGDSIAILNLCLTKIGHHPLAIARLVTRHITTRDYSSAWKLILSCPEDALKKLKENNGFIKSIIDLTKITKNTFTYDILGLHMPEIEALKAETAHRITQLHKSKTNTNTNTSDIYLSYVADKKFTIAEEFSWIAYGAGERCEAFFDAVCKPLATELDTSARVMFFRIEASRIFNKNPKFIAYGARTFLYTSEVSSAYEITSRAIENSAANTEVLHLNARASVILGDSVTTLAPEFNLSSAEHNFYNYSLHRKFCKSVLSGNTNEELHYRILSQASGLELHSPLSVIRQKTPIQKNPAPKVAICISGQLRGIEKSSTSIINDLASQTQGHIFVDTWKTQRSNFPTFTRVQRLIGNELWELLPAELKMPDGFRQYLPCTTKKLTSPITKIVTTDYVHAHLPQSTIRIEDESAFEKTVMENAPKLTLRGNLNQAKMFYKIKKCQELIDIYSSDNEIEFDIIIRTRPDLEISFPNIKEYIEAAYRNPNVIYVSYITALGYGDQFAIGSKKAMDIYASTWEKIWKQKQFKYSDSFDPQVSSFAGESLTANHLFFNGIDVKLIKPDKAYFTTMFSINAADIKDDLAEDLDMCELKPLLEEFQNRYLEMRTAKIAFT